MVYHYDYLITFLTVNRLQEIFKHLKGTTQRGLTDKHLDNLDYFKGLGAYHIVSKRFVEAMKSYLKEDVTFHAMQVSGRILLTTYTFYKSIKLCQ